MKKREKTRGHPTNSQAQRIIKDIRTVRDSGKSDIEIRETLGLGLRTYQKYTHNIHLEDQKVWYSITQEQMGTELLRMKQSLEETYKIAKDMANDPRCEDRLAALQSMNDFRLSIIHLLSEYPDFIRNVQSTNKIETKPYEEKYWWKDNAQQGRENEE